MPTVTKQVANNFKGHFGKYKKPLIGAAVVYVGFKAVQFGSREFFDPMITTTNRLMGSPLSNIVTETVGFELGFVGAQLLCVTFGKLKKKTAVVCSMLGVGAGYLASSYLDPLIRGTHNSLTNLILNNWEITNAMIVTGLVIGAAVGKIAKANEGNSVKKFLRS